MITVSPALKSEFQKLRGRGKNGAIQARVRIDYSDVNIDNTVVAVSADTLPESWIDHVFNGKDDMYTKWASLDGTWTLGEGYALIPSSEQRADLFEVGWWSKQRSIADRTFSDAPSSLYGEYLHGEKLYGEGQLQPEITLNFTERTISGFNLSFDNQRMEYAEDFTITLCDIDGNELYTNSIAGNTGTKYSFEITPVNLVAQFTLKIEKWSHAGRQAKLVEMFTSVTDLYTGNDIMNLRIAEARQVSGQGTPTGSTAAGECVVTLFNRNRKFDYDNTNSKLFNLIRENVRITPEIGDGAEWVPLGVFYAKAWDIPKRGITATVTGLDRLALMDETEYDISDIISAPADQNFSTDSDAEWNAGTRDNVTVTGGSLTL